MNRCKRSKRNRSDNRREKKYNKVRTKISRKNKTMVEYTREEKQAIMEEYKTSGLKNLVSVK
ncbi:MAG: hypothetical protein HFJ55_01035 [Clostridia bacterium]|jgi:hypothetical protein|nr:hypothetical protein [Clostridia bacterium]